jgi:carboxyl-terminal processing protease
MASTRTVVVTAACALVVLLTGIWLGGHPRDLPGPIRNAFVDDDRALRAELVNAIEDNFYRPVDEKKLDEASLKGMVDSLNDPFSSYLTPKEAGEEREAVSGEFEGVGMNVAEDKRGLKVLEVFDGSPASKAGIKDGDLIVAVNGRSLAGVDSKVATGRIRGKEGTSVRLEVITPSNDKTRTVSVKRERIEVPVARGKLVKRDGHKLGVVELASFSSGAHGLLRAEIDGLLKKGAEGIVLDLRGNPGGLLTEGVLVSSIFIEDGKIVSVRGRSRPSREYDAEGDAIASNVPVVVLVNGGSASASEIVTGALRDRHRAVVVGTRTFGKGLVQELEDLSNGGVLKLTVANYYLPGGETIGHSGIKPQVPARDNPNTPRDEALPVALDTLEKRVQ